MNDLVHTFALQSSAVSFLTSAVQFGFIIGTLIFAVLTIADRFSPSKVFFVSALLGAVFNLGIIWEGHTLTSLLSLRFLTGFFLAGIYPVGMKIAADYYREGLGKSLGFLVGALVVGTAFPHLLKDVTGSLPWKSVLVATSSLALFGGLLMLYLVPDGPYRKAGQKQKPNFSTFSRMFRNPNFRGAAFGYFGHMWELYAFWAFVPFLLKSYAMLHPEVSFNIPLLSFLIIGIGGLACVLGGYLSLRYGPKRIASWALGLSGLSSLLIPVMFSVGVSWLFVLFLLFWGMMVVADSPLFSTLVAQNVEAEIKGTALTIVNSIGFAITIVSIQLIGGLQALTSSPSIYLVLAIGPVLGLVALWGKKAGVEAVGADVFE